MALSPTSAGARTRRRRTGRRAPLAIAAAVVASLVLAACSGGDSDSGESNADAPVVAGGDLVVGVGALPPTLSPFITQPTPPRSFTVGPMYSYLTTLDAMTDGAPVQPSIATEWEQESPTAWVFTLKPDLQFPNGEALDAAAVKFAVDWVLDETNEAGIANAIGPIASAEVIDPTHVRFTLDSPEYDLARYLTILPLVPPADFAARGQDAFFTSPITTGMFTLESYTPGQELKLAKNPDSLSGTPNVDSVTFRVIVEDAARVSALRTGAVDVITKVPTDQVQALESADLNVVNINEARLYVGDLYKAEGPLNDVRVRQALNYALDTESLVANVMGGFGLDEEGQLSPTSVAGSCPTVTGYEHDTARANQLLTEAGVSNLNLTIGSSQGFLLNDSLLAQAIAAQLEELDAVASVEVQTMEYSNYLDVFYGRAPAQDMFMWGMSSAPGLNVTRNLGRFTTNHSDRNPGDYANPEYNALYDQLIGTPIDDPARQDLSCQLAQIVKDEALVLFGFYPPDIWGMTGDVQAFKVDANGNPRWLDVGKAQG